MNWLFSSSEPRLSVTGAQALVLGVLLWSMPACSDSPGESGICSTAALTQALDDASSGDTIELGACDVQGSFVVPAGVIIQGQTDASSRLVAEPGRVLLHFQGGATGNSVRNLGLVSIQGAVALKLASGATVALTDSTVLAHSGAGVYVSPSATLHMENVRVTGPITAANVDDSAWVDVAATQTEATSLMCSSTSTACAPGTVEPSPCSTCGAATRVCDACGRWRTLAATYGVIGDGATLTFENVDVTGFASYGVVVSNSTLDWDGGACDGHLGVGLYAAGRYTNVNLIDVSLSDTHQGLRGEPPFAAICTDDASCSSENAEINDNDRFGLVVASGVGTHVDLEANGNGDAAIWVGDSVDFSLMNAHVENNAFAGVVVVDSSGVEIEDTVISGQRTSIRTLGGFSGVEVGDGLHVLGTAFGVAVRRSTIINNERVGILTELDAKEVSAVSFEDVTVEAAGSAFGALAGTRSSDYAMVPAAPGEWDMGLTRLGAALTNDFAAPGSIDVAGIVTPSMLGAPDDYVGIVTPSM